jgi:zinc transport system ATP-binding protein
MKKNSKPIIQSAHVSFHYGHELILDDVSFSIYAGEFVGIIGPNGSGKTTLLRILLGLLQPQSGSVQIFGETVQGGKNAARIGYIPQKITQLETRFPITVEEVVALGRVNQKKLFTFLDKKDRDVVDQALDTVDLLPFRHRLITDLSGGQQQRAFIAKALAGQPQLLILDEPTVGIDIESQENFYALLTDLNKNHGLTILIVSHDVDVVMNEVHSVLCLNKTLIYHGNPKQFLKDDYLEKLYGKNRKYIIHGH